MEGTFLPFKCYNTAQITAAYNIMVITFLETTQANVIYTSSIPAMRLVSILVAIMPHKTTATASISIIIDMPMAPQRHGEDLV